MRRLLRTYIVALHAVAVAITLACGVPAIAQLTMTGVGGGSSGGGGACSGWTPATPSGLVAWYKADAGVTGNPVTAWADQSGNGYTMNPNGFTGPAFNSTGWGGKASLDFAGGNTTGLRTTADTVAIGTGTTSSIFMLGSFTGSSTGGAYIAGNGSNTIPGQSTNS